MTSTRRACTRYDQRVCLRQREDEAGTDRLHVERETVRHAKFGLHHRCRRRKGEVRGRGGHDDRVDVGRREAGIGDRGACGLRGELRGCLTLGSEMPPLDSGPGPNPFVGGVERLLELGVGHDPAGR
jgi:hypothetical protein